MILCDGVTSVFESLVSCVSAMPVVAVAHGHKLSAEYEVTAARKPQPRRGTPSKVTALVSEQRPFALAGSKTS
jgi:hypothetical protein